MQLDPNACSFYWVKVIGANGDTLCKFSFKPKDNETVFESEFKMVIEQHSGILVEEMSSIVSLINEQEIDDDTLTGPCLCSVLLIVDKPHRWADFNRLAMRKIDDQRIETTSGVGSTIVLATGNHVIGGKNGPTTGFFEVKVLDHNQYGTMSVMVGVVGEKEDPNDTSSRPHPHNGSRGDVDSTAAWYICGYSGGLYGNGKDNSDPQGQLTSGDTVGVSVNLDEGFVHFYRNGKRYGPGHTGVTGPVVLGVELYYNDENYSSFSILNHDPKFRKCDPHHSMVAEITPFPKLPSTQ